MRFRYPLQLILHWSPTVPGFSVIQDVANDVRTMDFVARRLTRIREDEGLPCSYDVLV